MGAQFNQFPNQALTTAPPPGVFAVTCIWGLLIQHISRMEFHTEEAGGEDPQGLQLGSSEAPPAELEEPFAPGQDQLGAGPSLPAGVWQHLTCTNDSAVHQMDGTLFAL